MHYSLCQRKLLPSARIGYAILPGERRAICPSHNGGFDISDPPISIGTSLPLSRSRQTILMNLRTYLILRIIASVGLCFLLATGAVLRQTESQHEIKLREAADALASQFGLQRLGLTGGGDIPSWDTAIRPLTGLCAQYVKADGSIGKNVCYGSGSVLAAAPGWFAGLYTTLFHPVTVVRRDLLPVKGALGTTNREAMGSVVVSRNPDIEIAEAWVEVRALLVLAGLILTALCLLTYLIVRRALWPLPRILDVLTRIGRGEPFSELPRFKLTELRTLSEGINELGDALEKSRRERSLLMHKLITLQEDERRSLARELHDEFGQSLAAVNAIASSIAYTAESVNPAVAQDAERIQTTVDHMMVLLRGMLRRLRPHGLDEQGLAESLKRLLADWEERCAGRTCFEFASSGEFGNLPESLVVNLYRITQECLTNVAKHAEATTVRVTLARHRNDAPDAPLAGRDWLELIVEDDGLAARDIGRAEPGMGILGMRERVTLLGGSLAVEARQASGLRVRAVIPLNTSQPSGATT